VLIADVCGHGLEAVEKASTIAFASAKPPTPATTLDGVVTVMENSFQRVTDRARLRNGVAARDQRRHRQGSRTVGIPEPLVSNRRPDPVDMAVTREARRPDRISGRRRRHNGSSSLPANGCWCTPTA
jgi:hypothetical protein